jgi:hypothetical protein
MFELMVRLELERQALIEKLLLSNTDDSGGHYFAIAGLIAVASLVLITMPPIFLIELPGLILIVGVLIFLALFTFGTIVLAPVGCMFL